MAEDSVFFLFLLVPLALGALLLLFARRQSESKSKRSWRRLLLGNLLVFIWLISLLFVAGEVYYRFMCDASDSINYSMLSLRWFRRYYVENSAGFRDNVEYSLKIEPGKRRITFLGDSFTAGQGIPSVEDRFPNRIRAAHPELEIHVLAKMGADTGDEIALMEKSLRNGYQADQVVLVYCLNDVSDMLSDWQERLNNIYAESKSWNWLQRNSYLVNTLSYRLKAARNPDIRNYYAFVSEAYHGQFWERQKERLTLLRDLVHEHGGRLLVVTFPFVNSVGPKYQFQPVHNQLNQFWEQLNVPHLDLLPVFSNLPPEKLIANRFDAHPNAYANELAAKEIEKFLRAEISSTNSPVQILDGDRKSSSAPTVR